MIDSIDENTGAIENKKGMWVVRWLRCQLLKFQGKTRDDGEVGSLPGTDNWPEMTWITRAHFPAKTNQKDSLECLAASRSKVRFAGVWPECSLTITMAWSPGQGGVENIFLRRTAENSTA